MYEEVLKDSSNEELRTDLVELLAAGNLAEIRNTIVDELVVPDSLQDALRQTLDAAGAPLPKELDWQRALKGVWASKWTDRAVSSRQQCGVKDEAVYMAVLVQPLIDAKYAFVIHTRSPLTGAKADEQLVELCVGLGESLVSNSPGRALSASVGPTDDPVVHTYPSKPDGVFAPEGGTHIFRSDSNGEDLEGFAGAGLYDSITVVECLHRPVCYTSEPLLFDSKVRNALLRKLFDLGRMVEANFNGQPQDIEGVVCKDGSLVVTQSRPQV
jgi:alpha-glucan,water dikinase